MRNIVIQDKSLGKEEHPRTIMLGISVPTCIPDAKITRCKCYDFGVKIIMINRLSKVNIAYYYVYYSKLMKF